MVRWLVLLFVPFSLVAIEPAPLQRAYEAYLRGETASDLSTRERAFNEALALYGREAESASSGKLYYNVANCYFQLGEYAWATLYYNRALRLLPRNRRIAASLEVAQTKLGILPTVQEGPWYSWLSPSERWYGFSVATIAVIALASLYVWKRRRPLYLAIMAVALPAFFFLAYSVAVHYFAPIQGIVMKGSSLYRDAGTHYARAKEIPVPAGTRVQVLEVTEDGKWLRVSEDDGTMGYLTADRLVLI